MKLVMDNYCVEIKVTGLDGKYSKKETAYLLNRITGAFRASSWYHDSLGCPAIAKRDMEIADDVYDFLESKGFYKD